MSVIFVYRSDELVGFARGTDTETEEGGCSAHTHQSGEWPPVPQAWADFAQEDAGAPQPPADAVCADAVIDWIGDCDPDPGDDSDAGADDELDAGTER